MGKLNRQFTLFVFYYFNKKHDLTLFPFNYYFIAYPKVIVLI